MAAQELAQGAAVAGLGEGDDPVVLVHGSALAVDAGAGGDAVEPHAVAQAHDEIGQLWIPRRLRQRLVETAVGLLKVEMRRLGSLVMRCADLHAVPAGAALAVDRERFAAAMTAAVSAHPRITIVREEITEIPDGVVVVATGPLTSPALSAAIQARLGQQHLYFYDAIAPIVTADSIDRSIVFPASRYDKGGDYQPFFNPTVLVWRFKDQAAENRAFQILHYDTDAQVIQSIKHWLKPGLCYSRACMAFSPRILASGHVVNDKSIALLTKIQKLSPGDEGITAKILKNQRLKELEHSRVLAIEGLIRGSDPVSPLARTSPVAIRGSHSAFWAAEPASRSAPPPSSTVEKYGPGMTTRPISSRITVRSTDPSPTPP